MSSIRQALIDARNLIATTDRWTTGEEARNANDEYVSAFSDNAVCFCSLGALDRASQKIGANYSEVVAVLSSAIPRNSDESPTLYRSIIGFNDAPGRKHEEVLAVFDRAIASLEKTQ